MQRFILRIHKLILKLIHKLIYKTQFQCFDLLKKKKNDKVINLKFNR
jgi:hypothetical protein